MLVYIDSSGCMPASVKKRFLINFVGEQNYADYRATDPEVFFARERGANSAAAWKGKTPDGKDAVIYRMVRSNHRPDVEVTDIQIWRQPNSAEWAILGITMGFRP